MRKGNWLTMISVLVGVILIYGAIAASMYVFQRNLLYFTSSPKPTREMSGVADMRELTFTTEDGLELFAWFKPPSDPALPTVALFHGNAGTLGGRGYKARLFMDQGYGAMLVEYRGYANNPGSPSEAGLYADARAALGQLKALGYSGKGVVLYGESLGTGVATQMAKEASDRGEAVAALILEAPFTSITDVGAGRYPFLPVRWLTKDKFESLARIKDAHAPLFIVHGEQDRTVPLALGKRLFDAALAPKESLWLTEAAHNDVFDHGAGEGILAFLRRRIAMHK